MEQDYCFLFEEQSPDWEGAKAHCEAYGDDVQLAELKNREVLDFSFATSSLNDSPHECIIS